MRILYQVGCGLLLLAAAPFWLARRGGRRQLRVIAARLGWGGGGGGEIRSDGGASAEGERVRRHGLERGGGSGGPDEEGGHRPGTPGGRPLWLHAVSVGEVAVAVTLARSLPPEVPLLVTTVTPTGQERAREALGGRAAIDYLPFDLAPPVTRFLARHQPRALVLIEGDYWPLLLSHARRRALPIAVVNGRVGDRSFARLRRIRPLGRLLPLQRVLFGGIRRFGVQSAQDRDRLLALGVDPARLTVTGNLKYDSPPPAAAPALAAAVERLAAGRPVLVAGSTMAGEEAAVLDAWSAAGGGARALLVLAPRHPERWAEVEGLLRARGLASVQRSRLDGAPRGPVAGEAAGQAVAMGQAAARQTAAAVPTTEVLLLDSMGELAGLYRLAAAAFIGGTLVPTGGHNPLEPARFGVAIAVGPSMHNFRDMAERFDRERAWRRVEDTEALGRVWREWLDDPAAARAQGGRAARLLAANRGALAATLEMLGPLLAAFTGEGAGHEAAASPGGGARGGADASEPRP
jgi:3-deoxy-D-manno-octulosonic-acid transferase